MQKKIRIQKLMIMVLSIVISVLLVGLLTGRNDKVPVVVVATNEIDPNIPLEKQGEHLKMESILKEDYERFGNTLVTDVNELMGAKLLYHLPAGSPIPRAALTKTKTSGEFASETAKYHTVFKLVDAVSSLPPGLQAGDFIDINLTINPEFTGDDESIISGPLLRNVRIQGVDQGTVYLLVSQKEFTELSLARDIGTFILQLPGQKDVNTCDVEMANIQQERNDEISKINEDQTLDEEQRNTQLAEMNAIYDFRLKTLQCFDEGDKPETITSDELINKVLGNQSNNEDGFSSDETFDVNDFMTEDETLNEESDQNEEE
ncbi:hypothetical protein IMZ31_20765 (plasmid) [Pontibacillus sp. ALD_SL1]|uniref:hypothetical protein n=1 Tax=Pontibacillus sp. ALD_SL1 TaxID=2777185 RepID=UPI001A962A5D|nr:hypothetical protein [Pontibacillus sp. ALD_SL1]QST02982.1 hypothetical protein IMZ31_20765 [Pontibacillus sp. ALD_SL1]